MQADTLDAAKQELSQLLEVLIDLRTQYTPSGQGVTGGNAPSARATASTDNMSADFRTALRGLLPTLLASYGATLSPADRALLRLLRTIESTLSYQSSGQPFSFTALFFSVLRLPTLSYSLCALGLGRLPVAYHTVMCVVQTRTGNVGGSPAMNQMRGEHETQGHCAHEKHTLGRHRNVRSSQSE